MNILGLTLLLLQVQLSSASGMVTKPGGSEPLGEATITLLPVAPGGPNPKIRSTVTEDDGRFTLRDIEPGDYRLTAQSERYGQAAYGQRRPGGPGSILSIAAGQQLSDLRLSMIPTGTLAGRVTGRNGEPLVFASVNAMKYAYRDGRKVLTVAQVTATDDRGEYRLFWLPPGQYFVVAATARAPFGPTLVPSVSPGATIVPADSLAIQQAFQLAELVRAETFPTGNTTVRILEDGTVQEEAWAPVYYPAATDARLATALDVVAGTARTGIDITIGPARVQKVRGRAVGVAPGSTLTVTLVPQDSGGLPAPISGKGASSVDGTFAFTGVLPGEYYVVVRDGRSGVIGSPLSIHVGNSDVENLIVGVGQALSLNGRILIDGISTDTGGANLPMGLSVVLVPDDLPMQSLAPRNTPIDVRTGLFAVNNLAAGTYRVRVTSLANPLYVKSVRLGLTDVTGSLRVAANTSDRLEIVLTAGSGSVEGVAIGSRGVPAPNATVVLVPNVARKNSELYKSVVTGSDGRFRFQDITPGDYKLFAWDDVETGAWQDPDFIRTYESRGLPVRLAEKSKEDVQLNVIYTP